MISAAQLGGGAAAQHLFTPQLQPAGARIGVFSNVNYWKNATLGQGYDLYVANRVILNAFWRSGDSVNNQTVMCFANATSGWILNSRVSHTMTLTLRGTGASFTNLGDVYLGLNVVALYFDNAGAGFYSINGGAITAINPAIGTYTPGNGTAQLGVGYDPAEANFAATQQSALWSAVIDSAGLTPAAVRAMTNVRNLLDRWNAPLTVTAASGLADLKRWVLWDGASATFTDVGQVLTKVGTGGGKSTMPAYLRYRVPQKARWDSVVTDEIGVVGVAGLQGHCPFNTTRFESSAADPSATGPAGVVLELATSYYGSISESVIQAGLSVNGANLQGNQAGANPYQGQGLPDGERSLSSCDMPGVVAGAAKTFIATDGMRASVGSDLLSAGTVEFVRVPVTQPLTWLARPAPNKVLISVGDSVNQFVAGLSNTDGIKGPVYQAYTVLERANAVAAGWRTMVMGWLQGTLFQRISDATRRAQILDQFVRGAGATNTEIWQGLGSGDYQFTTYATVAALIADYTLHIADVLAAGLPGLKYRVVGPTSLINETVPNSGGWTLPQLRTGMQNMVTAIADARVTYVSAAAPFVPFTVLPTAGANFGTDGKHLTVTGHVTYEAAMRAVIGY